MSRSNVSLTFPILRLSPALGKWLPEDGAAVCRGRVRLGLRYPQGKSSRNEVAISCWEEEEEEKTFDIKGK